MKYFVTSDIHGFYTEFIQALAENGFDAKNEEHKIIICGDLFDRGNEANKLLDYLLSLPEDKLYIVRGNHEDLFEDCLFQLENGMNVSMHHWSNRTLHTIAQLSNISEYDLVSGVFDFKKVKRSTKKYFELIKRAKDFIEIDNYIFVHGWIPPIEDWRNASDSYWNDARWLNGMEMASLGHIEENKTIVCGHYHTGWGHKNIHNTIKDEDDCFDIYKDKGVIALDACTVLSHKCNIFILEV